MGILNIQGLRVISQEIPNCCGNCKFNLWDECGPHCRNPKNWVQDDCEEEEGATAQMDDDDYGYIEWSMVCQNHERVKPFN